jgi:hypothetical protein
MALGVTEACLCRDTGARRVGEVAMKLEPFQLRVLLVGRGNQQADCAAVPSGVKLTCPATLPSTSSTAKARRPSNVQPTE